MSLKRHPRPPKELAARRKHKAPGVGQPQAIEASSATWDHHYAVGTTPWRSSGLSPITRRMLEQYATGLDALEIGCGTGVDSRGFAKLKFNYQGIDASSVAIDEARARYHAARSRFLCMDFFGHSSLNTFDVVYDKGVFHGLAGARRRTMFIRRVAIHLRPKGIWTTVCGSADKRDPDFPRGALYLRDLVGPAEVYFEIIEIVKAPYGLEDASHDFDAWYAVFRRR